MGKETPSGIVVRDIDEPMRLANFNDAGGDTTLWFEHPRTEAEARVELNRLKDLEERLARSPDADQAVKTFLALGKTEAAKVTEGTPWTIRKAVIRAVLWAEYPLAKRDKNGQPELEEPETIVRLQEIGRNFCRAPKNRGVKLLGGDVNLIRRKARELGSKYMHPTVLALLEEALDRAEGKTQHVGWEDAPEEGETEAPTANGAAAPVA